MLKKLAGLKNSEGNPSAAAEGEEKFNPGESQ